MFLGSRMAGVCPSNANCSTCPVGVGLETLIPGQRFAHKICPYCSQPGCNSL